MGGLGAALAAMLFVCWFGAIGRSPARLQPFLLTWTAAVAAIALVSHGAWQAWWIAAVAAGAAAFAAIASEMEQGAGTARNGPL